MVEQVKRTGTGSTRRNMMRLYEKYAQREKRKIEDAADSLHGADELTYDATTESRSKLASWAVALALAQKICGSQRNGRRPDMSIFGKRRKKNHQSAIASS